MLTVFVFLFSHSTLENGKQRFPIFAMKFVFTPKFCYAMCDFFVPMKNLEFWLYIAVIFLGGCHLKFSKKITTCEGQSKIFFFQKLPEKIM